MGRAHLHRRECGRLLRGRGRFRLGRGRLIAQRFVHGFRRGLAFQLLGHLVAPAENAGQPAGRLHFLRLCGGIFRVCAVDLFGIVVGFFLAVSFAGGALFQALGTTDLVLRIQSCALGVDVPAQIAQPLPQLGGGDIKDVQAGAQGQHDHHEVRRRTPAEQQQIAAQQRTDRAAAQPRIDAVLIARGHHPRGRNVGGDVREHDHRAAGEDQAQHQLERLSDQVLAAGIQNGQIAHRRAQHEAAAAEQAK